MRKFKKNDLYEFLTLQPGDTFCINSLRFWISIHQNRDQIRAFVDVKIKMTEEILRQNKVEISGSKFSFDSDWPLGNPSSSLIAHLRCLVGQSKGSSVSCLAFMFCFSPKRQKRFLKMASLTRWLTECGSREGYLSKNLVSLTDAFSELASTVISLPWKRHERSTDKWRAKVIASFHLFSFLSQAVKRRVRHYPQQTWKTQK